MEGYHWVTIGRSEQTGDDGEIQDCMGRKLVSKNF